MKDIEKYLKELADQIVVEDSESRIKRVLKRAEEKTNSKKQETQTEQTDN